MDTEFSYRLNGENLTNRSMCSGLKLGINYDYWLSNHSALRIGIHSYGVIVGDVDLLSERSNSNYHEAILGVLTSVQLGYIIKF